MRLVIIITIELYFKLIFLTAGSPQTFPLGTKKIILSTTYTEIFKIKKTSTIISNIAHSIYQNQQGLFSWFISEKGETSKI